MNEENVVKDDGIRIIKSPEYTCKKHGFIGNGLEARFTVLSRPEVSLMVDGCHLCLGEALKALVDTFPGIERVEEDL